MLFQNTGSIVILGIPDAGAVAIASSLLRFSRLCENLHYILNKQSHGYRDNSNKDEDEDDGVFSALCRGKQLVHNVFFQHVHLNPGWMKSCVSEGCESPCDPLSTDAITAIRAA